jgi:hypothetical protein
VRSGLHASLYMCRTTVGRTRRTSRRGSPSASPSPVKRRGIDAGRPTRHCGAFPTPAFLEVCTPYNVLGFRERAGTPGIPKQHQARHRAGLPRRCWRVRLAARSGPSRHLVVGPVRPSGAPVALLGRQPPSQARSRARGSSVLPGPPVASLDQLRGL